MKRWYIWREGYRFGPYEQSHAELMGRGFGTTFAAACEDLAIRNHGFRNNFNAEGLTWFGCRLFDNEHDAREAFG